MTSDISESSSYRSSDRVVLVDRGADEFFRWHCARCNSNCRYQSHTLEDCDLNNLARTDLRAANARRRSLPLHRAENG